jgi:hypothetical protein
MTTQAVTRTSEGRGVLYTWDALVANNDVGKAIETLNGSSHCVQMTGTFGAAVVLEGSNDGTNYSTLNDAQGNAISLTATGVKQIVELPRYIRPKSAAVTSVVVTVWALP